MIPFLRIGQFPAVCLWKCIPVYLFTFLCIEDIFMKACFLSSKETLWSVGYFTECLWPCVLLFPGCLDINFLNRDMKEIGEKHPDHICLLFTPLNIVK